MRLSQEYIDRLFNEIDTDTNAHELLTDLGMDIRYPHYTLQGTFRNVVNLRYFGDERITAESPWHAHRVDLWGSDPDLAMRLKDLGYNPRTRSRNNWRVGINRLQYDAIQEAAQKLRASAGNSEIVVGAFLTGKGGAALAQRFNLIPASHLHPSMIIAIESKGQIIEDEIIDVCAEPYEGPVYDLEVENLHNYIANGMVVHNSIYAWRGADWRNVQRFDQDLCHRTSESDDRSRRQRERARFPHGSSAKVAPQEGILSGAADRSACNTRARSAIMTERASC